MDEQEYEDEQHEKDDPIKTFKRFNKTLDEAWVKFVIGVWVLIGLYFVISLIF